MKREKLIKELKPYWQDLQREQIYFYNSIEAIEEEMSEELGIEGLEFIWCDNDIVGIGTMDKKLKLIHDYQLGG